MAQQLTQLTIFFSGTSETESERAALRKVVEELNRMLDGVHKITLKMISWPEDFRPGVNEDIQTEINRQVQGHYDIYIGVLGSRFGTETPRAGSGTVEEFQLAISQFQQDSTSVRVFFYFKRTGLDPLAIDTDQLKKVQKFRNGLAQQGVVYMDFKDTANFVEMVKKHLWNLIIDEWKNNAWQPVELTTPTSKTKKDVSEDEEPKTQIQKEDESITELVKETENEAEELGYFDLIEEFHSASDTLASKMGDIAEYTTQIGEQFTVHTDSANELMEKYGNKPNVGGSREAQTYLSKAKDVVNGAAKGLDTYTTKMTPSISAIKTYSAVMLTRFRDAYIFANEQFETPEVQKQKDVDALRQFIETMVSVVGQITDFQETVRSLPALTTKFKKSQKRTAAMLGELIAVIQIAIDQGNEILNMFE